jgi:hypothetical protein
VGYRESTVAWSNGKVEPPRKHARFPRGPIGLQFGGNGGKVHAGFAELIGGTYEPVGTFMSGVLMPPLALPGASRAISNGDYGVIMPRLLGAMMGVLSFLLFMIYRKGDWQRYSPFTMKLAAATYVIISGVLLAAAVWFPIPGVYLSGMAVMLALSLWVLKRQRPRVVVPNVVINRP